MSSDYRELIAELAEHIVSNSTSVKLMPSGVLVVSGEKINLKDFPSWIITYSKSEETEKFYNVLKDSPSPAIALETLKVEIRKCQKDSTSKTIKANGETIQSFVYDGMIPFISVTNSNKTLFFDKNTKKITDLDYTTYTAVVDKQFQLRPLPAVVEFNPYRPEQMYMGSYLGKECTHINTYSKPHWQLGRKLTDEEALDYCNLSPIIDEFFTHLFPDTKCKEFVYDWLHFALSSRCETYLVMNGAKGVGKNVLSNNICASLVGKENHKIAHKGALDQFNGILSECRMIVFDEFKIVDDDSINALKRYANADQMIERKGIDVGKTEKTYNSYIICNNALTDMKTEWDDRRFSVVDITDKKLEDVWSEKKIKKFVEMIDNPTSEEMIGFGYWLLYRNPTVMKSAFTVWKGSHFYKLCYTSMPEWAKMIIDEITSGHPKPYYDEAELKMMLKERTNGLNRFPQRTKVEDFLKNYKHKGESYLGSVEIDERTYYLQVSTEFVRSTQDSTGHEWLSLTEDLL
jgi:hypothetical protein